MNRDLDDLAAALDGALLRPGDPDYDAERLLFNSRFDDVMPAVVAKVAGPDDVRQAMEFAHAVGVPLAARSGGHCFAGSSTCDGIVVDLEALSAVEVDAQREHVRLGAGRTLFETYRELWPHRMAICGGTCPTVGVTGLALGGGLGVLSRRHGTTSDNLVEAEIVTPDGRIRRASADEDPDLFWALRGAGADGLGIVTGLTFRLVPVDATFTHAEYAFAWEAAADFLAAWQAWLPTAPRETWTGVLVVTQPPEGDAPPVAEIEVIHAGPPEELEAAVADLFAAVGTEPRRTLLDSGPFVDVEHDMYCRGLRPKEIALAEHTRAGRFPRSAFAATSEVAARPWSRSYISTVIDWVERHQRDRLSTPLAFERSHMVGGVLLEAADGAVNETPPGASAFVHRDNLLIAQFSVRWPHDASPDVVAANLDWLEGIGAATAPYRSGACYQNYADPTLDDPALAYYGANAKRLREVRRRYARAT